MILSVFMLAGLFSTGQLAAQDTKACASTAEKVSCVKSENACAPASKTAKVAHSPLVLQAAMPGSAVSAQSKPGCQSVTAASVNCDPSLCKKISCDPADCPPECKPLCGTAASVADKADVKEVKCQPAPLKAKVALAEGS